jgi:uncharacterized protein
MTVIDIVVNAHTEDVVRDRPAWSKSFFGDKIGVDPALLKGVSLEQYIERMDAAGIDRSFLIATKAGPAGHPESHRLAPERIAKMVEQYPDRFSALIGIDPTEGVRGVAEMQFAIESMGFVGAHLYPHWFGLAPDHRRYYPFYAKCAEIDVPIQMQVGHCLRYSSTNPLRSVGRPITLDTIACEIPELKLVGIHTGWPWTEEMIAVAYKHPNVYIGSDAYAPKHWPAEFVHFINTFGQDKVLFGTDFPVIDPIRAVTEIKDLGLREGSYEKFMGLNAAKLYGLAPSA